MEWPLLSSLPADRRDALVGAARRRRFARGEVVFHEEDPADSLHLIVSGHLSVRVTTPDGATALLNVLGPGDTVGELSLVGTAATTRSATVAALDPVETRLLGAAAFDAVRQDHPEVDRWLAALLGERVRELSARVRDLMYLGLDRRVYSALLELSEVFADPVVPLNQESLAEYVGGTRPSVNQVLQRLAGHGVVEIGRGRVTVLRAEELRRKLGGR